MTFEESIKRLDEIVKEMDNAELPLEESLELYKEGTLLIADCKKQLEEAELTVEKLSYKGEKND